MSEGAVPPLVQYWHEDPPAYIAELLGGFRDRNPDLRHLVFDRPAAARFIAERFGPREAAAFGACAIPAMQADYFRYCAVFALGGVYSDADFQCGASLRPLLPPAGRGRLFRGPQGNVINGLFAFGSPGHPFLALALEIATANIERRRFDRVYPSTGPPIFMTLVGLREHGSFEALIERASGTPFEEWVRDYCETIGEFGRVKPACDGIDVAPVAEQDAFLRVPDFALPYKHSDSHWVKRSGEIFH
jgi:mannosyltransferase OCH1-like enzyme